MTLFYTPCMSKCRERFNALMDFARDVEQEDPRGLPSVIKILMTGILSDYVVWRVSSKKFKYEDLTQPDWLLFPRGTPVGPSGETYCELCPEQLVTKRLRLGRDLLIPRPWHPQRLSSAIANIGEGREWGKWRKDRKNHIVEYWHPLGIAWCVNGNHSMMAGIIQGKGQCSINRLRDISPLYNCILCDGDNFTRSDGKIIHPMNSADFGAVFEIGRMLIKHGISV